MKIQIVFWWVTSLNVDSPYHFVFHLSVCLFVCLFIALAVSTYISCFSSLQYLILPLNDTDNQSYIVSPLHFFLWAIKLVSRLLPSRFKTNQGLTSLSLLLFKVTSIFMFYIFSLEFSACFQNNPRSVFLLLLVLLVHTHLLIFACMARGAIGGNPVESPRFSLVLFVGHALIALFVKICFMKSGRRAPKL